MWLLAKVRETWMLHVPAVFVIAADIASLPPGILLAHRIGGCGDKGVFQERVRG